MNIKKGFTLVELLVTLAIIAVMAAIVMSNTATAKAKSRDARRVSDIGNLQLALSLYFNKCGKYPTTLVLTDSCIANVSLGNYIAAIPVDPKTNVAYEYIVTTNPPTEYRLKAVFETNSPALRDSNCSAIGATSSASASASASGSGSSVSYDYCVKPY